MRPVAWGAGGFAKQPFSTKSTGPHKTDRPDRQGQVGGVLHLPLQGLPRSRLECVHG